ncbi:heat shock protein Hsp20 [Basidiobolus meristosporus CBS 931.73]|uniref:Heat shock protein Hsp20 n=1 Tax=Basidiobolus meristosporus CBS 931.73 TaxID=1314790 RepID=A0A1Y1Z7P4_9FUNG|nr:heat shock protein Hsp20 [Basidiobolus meristosporus CBS 931.73]|eukprot:ORY06302.1 heat shock protein Hsp20 [Basidiobolus meristosporus CBS 931.73]
MSLFSYRSRNECELDREVDEFFATFFGGRRFGDYWSPDIDMSDNGKELTVHAELPGVRKEDISLDVQGNNLIISGESPIRKEVSESRTFFCERRFGNFKRNIPLPNDVDTSKINAAYKDGILEVKIEKREDTSPKKISIV